MFVELLIDDYISDTSLEQEFIKNVAFAESGLWVTRDNELLHIEQMRSGHIHNCIAMLERNKPHYNEYTTIIADIYISKFSAELSKRYQPQDATEGFFDEGGSPF